MMFDRFLDLPVYFLWLLIAVLALLPKNSAADDLQIFILHSYHQEYPWTQKQNSGFVSAVKHQNPGHDLSFSTEYLDTKRVSFSSDYKLFFFRYLKEKYSSYQPDIVFSTDDNALRFLYEFRELLFPEAPVVFSGVNDRSVEKRLPKDAYSGVLEVKEVEKNISLIQAFQPALSKVFIIGDGSPTYRAIQNEVDRNIQTKFPDLKINSLASNRLDLIVDFLSEEGQCALLLATIGGFHDNNGEVLSLKRVIDNLSGSGEFMIVSMEDTYMLKGVLGGIVTSGRAQGENAAAIASRLFNGENIKNIPITQESPNIPTFEFGQLQRFGIDQKKLPESSIVLNQPRSLYQEFKQIIWTVLAIFFFLMFLISVLSFNIIRRKKAEKALAESEQFLDSIVENIPDMIFVKDANDLRFVRLNKAGEIIFGDKRENVIGSTVDDYFHPEKAEFFTHQDREVLKSKKQLDIPNEQFETKNHGERFLQTTKIPILDQYGNPLYLLGISRDVTVNLQSQKDKEELLSKLQQSQKMESIGTLAGGIAHDFNNILSSFLGYAELALLALDDQQKLQNYLTELLKGAGRAKDLVNQILTFSRRTELKKCPLTLSTIVKETLKLLRSSIPSTIEIKYDLQSDATIYADPTQMHQIIMNLCTNSYHAMRDTGGTLGVSLEETVVEEDRTLPIFDLPPGHYVKIKVSDTGCGMDEETRGRIFEPYFTTKGTESGTGLGLAVVHGIVKSHNGYINVYSELGKGTAIHVYFPVITDEAVDVTLDSVEEVVLGGTENILFVDDEEDIVSAAGTYLSDHGYTVTAFSNGVEAFNVFRKQPEAFDVLITDMTMPYMTGAELAQNALGVRPDLPIILCTGHSEIVNREKAMAMGIREYCEKPMRMQDMLQTVRRVLDRSADGPGG